MLTPKCPSRDVEILPVPAPFVGVGLAVALSELVLLGAIVAAAAIKKAVKSA